MEWSVPVNSMLKDEINKVNYTLIPPGFKGDVREVRLMQECLSKVIDALGEQSADAQGLNKVITTAEKLRNSPTHILYLLKDSSAKGGKGDVIGMLKVGHKHLFLFDERDQVREVEPLCVLDFYVQRDRQRHGYGRMLFDYMLRDNETSPFEIAIDGPSPKMEQFVARNYGVDRLMHQNNNFAVAPQFFKHADELRMSACSTPTVAAAVGRFAAHKPASAIANVIHGTGAQYRPKSSGEVARVARRSSTVTSPIDEPEPEPEPEPSAPAPEPSVPPAPEEHKSPERPSSLRVEPVVGVLAAAGGGAGGAAGAGEPSPAGSAVSRRDSQLTEQGFFDVKFYHNKLW